MLKILTFTSFVLFITAGIIESISDIKYGIITNKSLVRFFALGSLVVFPYYILLAPDMFWLYTGNVVSVTVLSLLLFYTESFAGGDCKLAIVLGFLYPSACYLVYRNFTVTLFAAQGLSFFLGYCWLILCVVRDLFCGRISLCKREIVSGFKLFLIRYLIVMVHLGILNLVLTGLMRVGFSVNPQFVWLIGFCIAWLTGRAECLRNRKLLVIEGLIILIVSLFTKVVPFSFSTGYLAFVLILLLIQTVSKPGFYTQIPVSALKSGMILSMEASMQFQGSKFKDLPGVSNEQLNSRLSELEVCSVQRWGKSRNVKYISIGRKIPFAIFVFFGYLLYFTIWGVVKCL